MATWPTQTPQNIDDALALVREVLGMDVAYVSRMDEHEQEILRLAGDSDGVGVREGMVVPRADTYCQRMLDGRIGNTVADAGAEPELRAVSGPAAYVGVPVELHDGELLGTLCAASGRPNPQLSDRDVRFMQVLARVLAAEFDRAELNARFAELDRAEEDRNRALQLYREVHHQLLLARYAMDREDELQANDHIEVATDRVADVIDSMLPDELPPGGLREADDLPG
ncbi:MAG TPA: GAF domain-containing protein [Solirubrobacteraceae bacterium]|nr:GAF domain-containing protein [Solirubrobacteraceae bacterium]